MVRLVGPGRIAIQSKYGFEPEEHWAWNDLGPSGHLEQLEQPAVQVAPEDRGPEP